MSNYGWHWGPCNRRGIPAGTVIALIVFTVFVSHRRTIAEISDVIMIAGAVMTGLTLTVLVTGIVIIARRARKREYQPVKVISVRPLENRESGTVMVLGVPHAVNCLIARNPGPAEWDGSIFSWCTCKAASTGVITSRKND